MKANVSCFFMLCKNETEKECLEKGLFGDQDFRLPQLQAIKKGDIGFLLNVSDNVLIGIFSAESSAQLKIDPNAWEGRFPAQVKVSLLDSLQRISGASMKLRNIIELKKMPGRSYYIPTASTHGPEITERVLSLFNTANLNEYAVVEEIGVLPKSSLEDVAGLKEVKNFIHQRIIAPFEDEEAAYSLGLRVGGGMLLFGPPGTGKTLIARSIAKNIQAKFIDISPSVITGYPGDAEKRLEKIFSAIEKEPRAVVFLDEAEWILCKRNEQTSSVMQRITPVLLAQLSNIFKQKSKPIIVIAATNQPEMIDPAFLRPGRFDKLFYTRLPDRDARQEIIRLQLKERKKELTDNNISYITEKLAGYSGADIEYIVEEASYRAFNRRKENRAAISEDDLVTTIESTPKSVTSADIQKYEKWAKERGLNI